LSHLQKKKKRRWEKWNPKGVVGLGGKEKAHWSVSACMRLTISQVAERGAYRKSNSKKPAKKKNVPLGKKRNHLLMKADLGNTNFHKREEKEKDTGGAKGECEKKKGFQKKGGRKKKKTDIKTAGKHLYRPKAEETKKPSAPGRDYEGGIEGSAKGESTVFRP